MIQHATNDVQHNAHHHHAGTRPARGGVGHLPEKRVRQPPTDRPERTNAKRVHTDDDIGPRHTTTGAVPRGRGHRTILDGKEPLPPQNVQGHINEREEGRQQQHRSQFETGPGNKLLRRHLVLRHRRTHDHQQATDQHPTETHARTTNTDAHTNTHTHEKRKKKGETPDQVRATRVTKERKNDRNKPAPPTDRQTSRPAAAAHNADDRLTRTLLLGVRRTTAVLPGTPIVRKHNPQDGTRRVAQRRHVLPRKVRSRRRRHRQGTREKRRRRQPGEESDPPHDKLRTQSHTPRTGLRNEVQKRVPTHPTVKLLRVTSDRPEVLDETGTALTVNLRTRNDAQIQDDDRPTPGLEVVPPNANGELRPLARTSVVVGDLQPNRGTRTPRNTSERRTTGTRTHGTNKGTRTQQNTATRQRPNRATSRRTGRHRDGGRQGQGLHRKPNRTQRTRQKRKQRTHQTTPQTRPTTEKRPPLYL